ncbi:MAG: hypothetical protein IPM54_35755 [Polyangiaceae bacterium]|nr:hypothetical protein [Polyangiaceae bacterium]
MHDLISSGHVGPILSSLFVDVFGTLGFLFIMGVALVERARHLRQARAADATASDVNQKFVPGPAVLFGEVEYAQGASVAVRVDVDQDGEETESSGVWSHKWTEKNRRVDIAPFYLRVAEDKRIRIESTREVFLVDSMDGIIRVELTKRTRYAELTPGEKIYACGELVRAHDPESPTEGGYRSSREALVLRPMPKQPMLLSTEPLGARFRERASFHGVVVVLTAIVAILCHAFFFGFHARRYLGQTVDANITMLHDFTTRDGEGDITRHCRVWLNPANGPIFSDDVDALKCDQLREGDVVPVRLVPGILSSRSTIGPDVTVSTGAFMFIPLVLSAWFAYRHNEKATRPWYMNKVVDTAPGRLEETMPAQDAKMSRS